jgi:hypothetical protein
MQHFTSINPCEKMFIIRIIIISFDRVMTIIINCNDLNSNANIDNDNKVYNNDVSLHF